MQAGVRASPFGEAHLSAVGARMTVAADDKHRYGIDRRLLRVSDDTAAGWGAWVTAASDPSFIVVLTIRTTGRDRRAPSLSALAAADLVPRASRRKVGSNSAPLLPPRAKSLTEPRRHGARILPGGAARPPDRPPHRGDAGGFPSISVLPCRDTRRG